MELVTIIAKLKVNSPYVGMTYMDWSLNQFPSNTLLYFNVLHYSGTTATITGEYRNNRGHW